MQEWLERIMLSLCIFILIITCQVVVGRYKKLSLQYDDLQQQICWMKTSVEWLNRIELNEDNIELIRINNRQNNELNRIYKMLHEQG